MIHRAFRRALAVALCASLLQAQQGLAVSEALAGMVSAPVAGTQAAGNVGAAGAAGSVSQVSIGSFGIAPSASLGGSVLPKLGGLPGVESAGAAPSAPMSLPGVQILSAPSVSRSGVSARVGGPVHAAGIPAASGSSLGKVLPASNTGKTVSPAAAASLSGASKRAAVSGRSSSKAGVSEKLGRLGTSILRAPKAAAVSLRRFFDGNRGGDFAAGASAEGRKPSTFGSREPGRAGRDVAAASLERSYPGGKPLPAEPGTPDSIKKISLKPSGTYTPSPEDWNDEVIYFVITDRFAREHPYKTYGDPAKNNTRHGGNIRGVISKLDYLEELGITTILLPPVNMSTPEAYHGYHPINFLAMDPHLGTMQDFKELVAEAHKRGIKVVLDMVFNHAGPVIEYNEGFKWEGLDKPQKTIKRWQYDLMPKELADAKHFHRRGSIDDWNDHDQVTWGDFPGGLNQLATENRETQDILIDIAKWWIKETDVDGFRLDTYKHVAESFWEKFFSQTREYAAGLGKSNFMYLGEIYDGDPNAVAPYVRPDRLSHAYNYPEYFWVDQALHGEAPTRILEDAAKRMQSLLGDGVRHLLRFLDNQDKPRFRRGRDPISLVRVALAFTLFSVGLPLVYYGTEQGYIRAGSDNERLDKVNDDGGSSMDDFREDMFPEGKFRAANSRGNDFDTGYEGYQSLKQLLGVRKSLTALRRGKQYPRWADQFGPGIYAFSRIHEGEEVVVVLNTANEPRSAEMWVDGDLNPGGSQFRDAMDLEYATASKAQEGGGAKVFVNVPAHGVRVLIRKP